MRFDETPAQHATKPIAHDLNETGLREWYRPRDLLSDGIECAIGADSAQSGTVDSIMLGQAMAGYRRYG
ncbi:hypothetical protein ACFC0D_03185 [Streptomyces sp. NPDC056222]|uniref:hypothetical protein n=1 Tax=Streptomyces sp. NPDC056222 TaxID=3345749 RepID=UPI0035E30ED5